MDRYDQWKLDNGERDSCECDKCGEVVREENITCFGTWFAEYWYCDKCMEDVSIYEGKHNLGECT